jgi:hypothetical protein
MCVKYTLRESGTSPSSANDTFETLTEIAASDRSSVPAQPVDATHELNRSAGVSKFNVFRGLSLSCLATLFNSPCE